MESSALRNRYTGRRQLMVAMVLGTALSAVGSTPGIAAVPGPSQVKAATDISRYCTACWRNARLHPDSWQDCTQEVFARLLERVDPDAWDQLLRSEGEDRREFLRAIDAVKKRTQRSSRKWTNTQTETVADRSSEG